MVRYPEMLRDELTSLDKQMTDLQNRKQGIIDQVTSECLHPLESVYELPYKPAEWVSSSPPWLICARCGLAEEGWGCGHKVLRHADFKDVPKISQAIFDRLITKRVWQSR